MSLFELKDVGKIYESGVGQSVEALRGINLKIEKGEFTSIVGPSGSGKSTLLNIMSGLDKVSSGQVSLSGNEISKLTDTELSEFRRDHIGFIFQAYNLIPVLTVRENIEYIMQLQGVSEIERRKRVSEVLGEVGLEGMENRFPNQLSGGQQQRVAVARAIAALPDIILADEPTANLDSKTGSDLLDLMGELNRRHETTFIFSTHDPLIMDRANRLVILKDGRIVEDHDKS